MAVYMNVRQGARPKSIKINLLPFVLTLIVFTSCALVNSAQAFDFRRGTTTIDAPGISIQQRNGLFGSGENRYRDALGNQWSEKRSWFGRTQREGAVFGSRISSNPRNLRVMAPNGSVLVEKHRPWLGGESTHINATEMLHSLTNILSPGIHVPNQVTPGAGLFNP
jgi:hypothetical protein